MGQHTSEVFVSSPGCSMVSKMPAVAGFPTLGEIKGFRPPQKVKKRQTLDMGLDLSSSCVGWAFGIKPNPMYWGKLVFRTNAEVGEKLFAFDEFLGEMFKSLHPDRLFVEKVLTRKGKTTERHLEIMGIVRSVWREYSQEEILPSWIIPARTVKNALQVERGRDHDANKLIMVNKINDLYHLNLKFHNKSKYQSDDDTADALAILATAWKS